MARPSREFKQLAQKFIPLRITNMKGVNLNLFSFNYDQTLALFTLHPDGTIYHRYGVRDETSATSRMSMRALLKMMKKSLKEHEKYSQNPSPPKLNSPTYAEDIPPLVRRLKKKKNKCIHCHTINDMRREWARKKGTFSEKLIWIWPLPDEIGLVIDVKDPPRVAEILVSSPAARAGLQKGDRILTLGGKKVFTQADMSAVLDGLPARTQLLKVEYIRRGKKRRAQLRLAGDWKEITPLRYSWRGSMWSIFPTPGFGGKQLTRRELKKLGVRRKIFAFKVKYIVTWGGAISRKYGLSVRRAGLRKGDIFLSINGKEDFQSVRHFHAWYRLNLKAGQRVEVKVARKRRGSYRLVKIKYAIPR